MPIGTLGNQIIEKAKQLPTRKQAGAVRLPPEQEAGFRANIERLAAKYRVPPDWFLIMFVMESLMDYRYLGDGSPVYAGLNNLRQEYWTHFKFRPGMNAIEQTAIGGPIDNYYAENFQRARTLDLGSFYMANLTPAYVNKPRDEALSLPRQARDLYDSAGRISKVSIEGGLYKRVQEFIGQDATPVAADANTSQLDTPTSGGLGDNLTLYGKSCLPPTTLAEAVTWTGCMLTRVVVNAGSSALSTPGAVLGGQPLKTGQDAGLAYSGPPVPGGFIIPVGGRWTFTSSYGPRSGKLHAGIDLAAPVGTPIYAARAGLVILADPDTDPGGYGALVILDHGDAPGVPRFSAYGHMSQVIAITGKTVKQGEVIALVGSKGRSTGPHLHFELRRTAYGRGYAGTVDPLAFMPQIGRKRT